MENYDVFMNVMMEYFRIYIEQLDSSEDNCDEYYTTDKGRAIREFRNFLDYQGIEHPDWMKEYYEEL